MFTSFTAKKPQRLPSGAAVHTLFEQAREREGGLSECIQGSTLSIENGFVRSHKSKAALPFPLLDLGLQSSR